MAEKFYPEVENLGLNCQFWDDQRGCQFPKVNLQGRHSCEGVVDDVCLWVKDGRVPQSLTEEQQLEIKTRIPGFLGGAVLPPGETS